MIYHKFGWPATCVWLQLPIYSVHQLEEHYQDRFRLYINRTVGQGQEALTPTMVTIINVLFVWLLDFVAFGATTQGHFWLGLSAIYLTIVNGILHIIGALRQMEYNPGLASAVLLFLPGGTWLLNLFNQASAAGRLEQILGLFLVLILHVAIVLLTIATGSQQIHLEQSHQDGPSVRPTP